MKNVLFLFSANDVSFSLLPFLLKYKVDNKNIPIREPYHSGDLDESAVTGKFKFKFEDTNIDLLYEKNIPHDYNGMFDYLNSIQSNRYEKIYFFIEWSSFNSNLKHFGNVEIIYYKADENYHKPDGEIKDILSQYKIISSASLSFKHKNFYFEPIVNLFVFYYIFGFNYLSYSKLDINKSNLMGMYYIKGYRNVRDIFYNEFIKTIFEKQHCFL
jgi:hypothetical protein